MELDYRLSPLEERIAEDSRSQRFAEFFTRLPRPALYNGSQAYLNPEALDLTGFIGRLPEGTSEERVIAGDYSEFLEELEETGSAEVSLATATGDIIPVKMKNAVWRYRDKDVSYRTINDLRELKREESRREEAEVLSTRDDLTGLLNRRGLSDALKKDIMKAEREIYDNLALVLYDLDEFKPVNDHYGHPMGDRLLEVFGMRLNGAIRGSDYAGRLGGDEFVTVFPDTSEEKAKEALARISGHLRESVNIKGTLPGEKDYDDERGFRFSSGMAMWKRGDESSHMLKRADNEMMAEKESKNLDR